jgi:Mn-dependent DtxR family transcriptional regulator
MAGNTNDLAKKLSVSKRTVHRMLEQLRGEGLNFRYSHHRKTYVMENESLIDK